jgi:hypothetical protein
MGYIKKRISELIKEHGGKKNASNESENWFNNAIKPANIKEAQLTRHRFKPGKIYVFRYAPKYANELPWFDQNPVVLAIEHIDKNDLGVNLNLLPVPFKEKLLDDLYTRMQGQINGVSAYGVINKNQDALRQSPLRITYDGMKSYLEKFGYAFAIRQYIPSRKNGQVVVSYAKWPEIALCRFMELSGITTIQLKRLFNNYLKRNI